MKERRAHPRIRSENKVLITLLPIPDAPEPEEHSFLCSTANLSIGGMQFTTKHPPAVGKTLGLRIFTADPDESFEMQGRVVWTGDAGAGKSSVGIQFADTALETLTAWRKMLDRKTAAANKRTRRR